jgi:MYXO-CTERM domain-containing protein
MKTLRLHAALFAGSALVAVSSIASAAPFSFDPPGQLVPATSGKGRVDSKVYAPTMRFPMEQPGAFANSQVYGRGGGSGPGGGQCDVQNYSYPWHDNYCEKRTWDMPLCPSGTGHQGQDIRPGTCTKAVHWVVAAQNGRITQVGSYSVYLTAADGTRYDYLHMSNVQVAVGATVKRGQRLGKVSNVFGTTPTTIHLHFNLKQTVAGMGFIFVPPYLSLVESFKRLLDPTLPIPDAGVDESDAGNGVIPLPEAGAIPDEPEPLPAKEDSVPNADGAIAPEQSGCGCSHSGSTSGALGAALMVAAVLIASRRKRTR